MRLIHLMQTPEFWGFLVAGVGAYFFGYYRGRRDEREDQLWRRASDAAKRIHQETSARRHIPQIRRGEIIRKPNL